jgi:hypothetical protein
VRRWGTKWVQFINSTNLQNLSNSNWLFITNSSTIKKRRRRRYASSRLSRNARIHGSTKETVDGKCLPVSWCLVLGRCVALVRSLHIVKNTPPRLLCDILVGVSQNRVTAVERRRHASPSKIYDWYCAYTTSGVRVPWYLHTHIQYRVNITIYQWLP